MTQPKMLKVKTPPCVMCNETSVVEVTPEQYAELVAGVKHIQQIFPEKDASARELLISGTHAQCWEKLFGLDSEDSEDDLEDAEDDQII